MPSIIRAIISVQPTAIARKPTLTTPVATSATAMTSLVHLGYLAGHHRAFPRRGARREAKGPPSTGQHPAEPGGRQEAKGPEAGAEAPGRADRPAGHRRQTARDRARRTRIW